MTRSIFLAAGVLLVGSLGGCAAMHASDTVATHPSEDPAMRLGNFSVSLAVKDIGASRAFYEKLGFKMVSGDQSKNWVVLQNETARIGLFQGMFPRNTLTFNPGWDGNKATLPDFEDVRDLQKTFKARGLTPAPAADESTTGPAYLMLTDPDGNPILIDQHVPSPKKKT
jgi:catechol 2,3-dioxygenase-like lactoylglutathione lyase family enzyme